MIIDLDLKVNTWENDDKMFPIIWDVPFAADDRDHRDWLQRGLGVAR